MADSDPLNSNSYGYSRENANPLSIRGGAPPGFRYPNPYTAYGGALSGPPRRSATDSPGFGGAAGQLLSAADALSPPQPYGKKYRGAETEAAPFTARRSLWVPSEDDFPFDVQYRGRRQTSGGDERFARWGSVDHLAAAVGDEFPRPNVSEIAALGDLRSSRNAPAAQPSSLASDARHFAPPAPAARKPDPAVWERLESAAKIRLKRVTEARLAKNDEVPVKAFKECLLGCRVYGTESISADGMKRHLVSHVELATTRQKEDVYVRGTVAVLLEDMCLDVEVPPPQRKLERQRMARALLKPSKTGKGLEAGLIETKVTGHCSDPLVRRCSRDLAYGGCKGLKHPESIRRCDKCRSWFHVSCGQMVLGSGISCAEAVYETLCRTCSRILIGGWGKDPGPSVQKQEALVRLKRREMLALLERELDSGWPEGVFDLNLTTEPGAMRNARGPDGKRAAISANAEEGGGASDTADVRGLERPRCAAKGCKRLTRPDSKFCSDGCGVRNAQSLLSDALRHSLEERLGRERGRRLREVRETRTLKHEIGLTLKKLQHCRPPAFKPEHEATLLALVEKRRRLWKRLIEIGTYWEVVSGSKSLAVGRAPKQKIAGARKAPAAGLRITDGDDLTDGGASVNDNRIKSVSARKQGFAPKDLADGVDVGKDDDRAKDARDQQPLRTVHTVDAAEAEAVASMMAMQANGRRKETPLDDPVVEIDVDGGWSRAPRACPKGGSSSDSVTAQAGGLGASNGVGGALRNGQVSNTSNGVVSESSDSPGERHMGEDGKCEKKRKSASGEPVCSKAVQVPRKSSSPPLPPRKILRDGLQHLTCVYCGGETGPRVTQHLEQCYREAAALRNERLESATLRPKPKHRCPVPGTGPVPGPILLSESSVDVGRQLLSRPVCYADFGDLPEPRLFQLHEDLKGWLWSPARLDFLHKELIRQRNAAVLELDALDSEEADLETQLRREWKEEGCRPAQRIPVQRTRIMSSTRP